jgi:hypothetical protein
MSCDKKPLNIEAWNESAQTCPVDYCKRLMLQAKKRVLWILCAVQGRNLAGL